MRVFRACGAITHHRARLQTEHLFAVGPNVAVDKIPCQTNFYQQRQEFWLKLDFVCRWMQRSLLNPLKKRAFLLFRIISPVASGSDCQRNELLMEQMKGWRSFLDTFPIEYCRQHQILVVERLGKPIGLVSEATTDIAIDCRTLRVGIAVGTVVTSRPPAQIPTRSVSPCATPIPDSSSDT